MTQTDKPIHPAQRALVLASSSRYRKQQLEDRLGLNVQISAPNIEEVCRADESPRDMSLRLSLAKASAVADDSPPGALIIAGDQTAEYKGMLLRKPDNRDAAIEQLLSFSEQEICFYSGICVHDSHNDKHHVDSVMTQVRFRRLSYQQIAFYVDQDEPFDCVGAFKNEGLGIALFEAIMSEDPSALTGLPLIRLCSMLNDCGYDVLSAPRPL